jgi:hypothetical protein
MMSFGHDDVIKMSTPRKLVCPRTHMFLKDSMSSFVKLWRDDLSDSASVPLTYTNFNPEVVTNNPRLPTYKTLFVTHSFCERITQCSDQQCRWWTKFRKPVTFFTYVSSFKLISSTRNKRLIVSQCQFENYSQTALQRNGWMSMTRAQAWKMLSTSHINTYVLSRKQCDNPEAHSDIRSRQYEIQETQGY